MDFLLPIESLLASGDGFDSIIEIAIFLIFIVISAIGWLINKAKESSGGGERYTSNQQQSTSNNRGNTSNISKLEDFLTQIGATDHKNTAPPIPRAKPVSAPPPRPVTAPQPVAIPLAQRPGIKPMKKRGNIKPPPTPKKTQKRILTQAKVQQQQNTPSKKPRKVQAPSGSIALNNPAGLRQAIMMQEILSAPKALRQSNDLWD